MNLIKVLGIRNTASGLAMIEKGVRKDYVYHAEVHMGLNNDVLLVSRNGNWKMLLTEREFTEELVTEPATDWPTESPKKSILTSTYLRDLYRDGLLKYSAKEAGEMLWAIKAAEKGGLFDV